MFLTNHTLTGILLGLNIDNVVVLGPTALASHLILDATPHFGNNIKFNDPMFYVLGTLDFCSSVTVAALAVLTWPERAIPLAVGIAGAWLPDLVYIPVAVFSQRRIEHWFPWYKPMLAFLGKIQWFEQPIGIITEISWAALMLTILWYYL